MNREKTISIYYILFLFLVLAIPFVLADGTYDDLSTTVTVSNSAPTVGTITCSPSTLTLNNETTTLLNCTATVSDSNGYQDILGIRGEFYNDSQGASANYSIHYNNATCSFTENGTAPTNSTVECTFGIYYYADPNDWTIYLNVSDVAGETGNNTGKVTINQLISLNVTNTTIPFGSVELGQESSQVTTTIRNTGNVNIDIKVNESLNGGNMTCDGAGSANINVSADASGVRYNTTDGFVFDETSWRLTQDDDTRDVNWAKNNDASDSTPPEYNLYWKIKLPASGISGTCTTTTRISATAS